jgi:hypothetical protein
LCVQVREYSALQNPRMPAHMARDVVTVWAKHNISEPQQTWQVGPDGVGSLSLLLPTGITEAQLQAYLAPYAAHAVLHFRNPAHLLVGLKDAGRQTALQQRIDRLRTAIDISN